MPPCKKNCANLYVFALCCYTTRRRVTNDSFLSSFRNKRVASRDSPRGKLDAAAEEEERARYFTDVGVKTIVVMSSRQPGEFHARNTERIGFQPSANFSTRCTPCSRPVRENEHIAIVRALISRISEK